MIRPINKLLSAIKKKFLDFLATIRFYKTPFFIVFGPRGYKFKDTLNIFNIVRPGDIILRRYDSYMSSFMIPGYWKHAGIVFDKHTVIHSVGKGVCTEDVLQFCRTDEICILRVPGLKKEDKEKILNRAAKVLGSNYDYDFNVKDTSAFYCSELVAFALKDYVKFEPKSHLILGAFPTFPTIMPQHLFEHKDLKIIYDSRKNQK